MDKIEGSVLDRVPPGALSLTLTRSTIKMVHSRTWSVDKANQVWDILIALQGRGEYLINGQRLSLSPGQALLIPPHTRFQGWTESEEPYLGIAQHFTLKIFGDHDLLDLMELSPVAGLAPWPVMEPLAWHFRQSAPPGSITMPQTAQFMVLLNAYINAAFRGWKPAAAGRIEGAAGIDVAVMQAASRISGAPLDPDIAQTALAEAPYNPDYFQREFQRRIGRTPRKYQEFCRMERAMHLLESGHNVGATAALVGYSDPYYFSRMFKRTMGRSPREHLERISLSRDGRLMHFDEDAQEALIAAGITPSRG